METSTQWIKMEDGVEVFVKKWASTDSIPKGIVQISHGMAEHIERYNDFAQYLVSTGFIVYGNDHRGHGHTGKKMGSLGYLADHNGFEKLVNDLHSINQKIREEMPSLPLYMFGHSMGSFVLRRYIQRYPYYIQGAILSGTAGDPGIAGKIGKKIAMREIRKKGGKAPSPFLNRLTFGSYNKNIPHPETEFDWLTRDQHKVQEYVKDPLCGFICSSGFFYDLFSGLQKIHDDQQIREIPPELPILIMSGENDPVGGKGLKGVHNSARQLEENGLNNIKVAFFEHGRHELLNEINKLEIYRYIYEWLEEEIGE